MHESRRSQIMTNVRDDYQYAETHEWVYVEGDKATVGISEHAQSMLGEVVYVELPDIGDEFAEGEDICVVESVKAASDIYTPVSGEVIAINDQLEENPGLVNESPYERGWLYQVKLTNTEEIQNLMDAESYQNILQGNN
jgi:glycine cleavage system H protein